MDPARPRMKRRVAAIFDSLPTEAQRLVEIELAWKQHRTPLYGTNGPRMRRSGRFRRRLLAQLAGEQNWRCCHCGVRTNEAVHPDDEPTIEHVIPRALGGTDAEGNLAMACRACNTTRGHDLAWTPTPKKDNAP